MQDRIPTPGQEGRVLITPENGGSAYYAKIQMADNPTQPGTALNKENLLQDATCSILGIPDSSVPNDAFAKLALGIGKYGYAITVIAPDGTPIPGATISGAQTPAGGTPVTDDYGLAVIVSTEQSVSITVQSDLYIDLEPEIDVEIESTGIVTPYAVTMPYVNGAVRVETSGIYTHTAAVSSIDASAVGAGGGGGGAGVYLRTSNYTYFSGANGGGGGYAANQTGLVPSEDQTISVLIGAGGDGGTAIQYGVTRPTAGEKGGDGGTTSISIGNTTVSAPGGTGGDGGPDSESYGQATPGNGTGGIGSTGLPAQSGTDGTQSAFDDPSIFEAGGGGGGGRGGQSSTSPTPSNGASGGQPNGGRGQGWGDGKEPQPGNKSGGGGGGGYSRGAATSNGASGGDGLAFFIFQHGTNEVAT